MTATRTAGQAAYEAAVAWRRARYGTPHLTSPPRWERISAQGREYWEAVARAVAEHIAQEQGRDG